MRKGNRICKVCGVSYYACPDSVRLQNWRSMCDTPEHYQIYQTLVMYAREMITASTAVEMLTGIGVTPDTIDGLDPQKQDEIRGIFAAAHTAVQSRDNTDTSENTSSKKMRRSVKE